MTTSRFPKGIRKYIRKEKARIRREYSDSPEKQKEEVKRVYEAIMGGNKKNNKNDKSYTIV